MSLFIAIMVKPFALLVLSMLVLLPARRAVERLPDSRVRRILLLRVSGR